MRHEVRRPVDCQDGDVRCRPGIRLVERALDATRAELDVSRIALRERKYGRGQEKPNEQENSWLHVPSLFVFIMMKYTETQERSPSDGNEDSRATQEDARGQGLWSRDYI